MAAISKDVILKGEKIDGTTIELEIPMESKKVTTSNNINSFNRPKTNPSASNPRETRALNMNRIQVEIQVTAKISDEFAAKNHNGSGDRPDLSNKEEWISEAHRLNLANNILDLRATNEDTVSLTSEFSGYMHNLDWQEKSSNESSIYDVTIKLVDEIPMNN